MFDRIWFIAAAAVFSLSTAASAATLPALTDSYEGTYNVESVNTGANLHSFWLPGFVASNYWQFDSSGGTFDYSGGVASLTGTIVNNTDATKKFGVDVNFNFTVKGGRVPKCELGSSCAGAQFLNQASFFEYFTFDAATLTGLDTLTGLMLNLTMAPADGTYPPQLGFGANNKDLNEFGLSTWLFWEVTENWTGQHYAGTGQGDINIELSAIPLPASLPLMLGAFGMLGWVARRRRRAHA